MRAKDDWSHLLLPRTKGFDLLVSSTFAHGNLLLLLLRLGEVELGLGDRPSLEEVVPVT